MAGCGALFEVLGHLRFTATGGCPKSLEGSVVKLKGSNGDIFEVSAEAACVSSMVRKTVIANGVAAEIPIPVGKELMNKVIDFMKHHKDTPCPELRTPLESDILTECGASKWDSTFVKVERDKLFDLMLAATLFDIQSLFFLASAQASLMFKEKSGDKLRKDMNLNNDLPANEEESLKSALNVLREKKKQSPLDEESNDIAVNAAVLAGMTTSAQKQGVPAEKKKEVGLMTLSGKSWRLAMWTSAIMMNWRVADRAPDEVCADREIMSVAIALSRGDALKYATGDLLGDKSLILEAVQLKGAALANAGASLKADKAFVTEATAINGGAMQGASESLRSDAAFVLEVTSAGLSGSAVNGASSSLTGDSAFILSAVVKDPEAFKHASEDLKSDKQFALSAAAKNGLTLQYMSSAFRADKDITATAVMENKMAALFAHASRRAELGVLVPSDFEGYSIQDKFGLIDKKAPMAPGASMRISSSWDEGVEFNPSFYLKSEKLVQFSASSTMSANMGQANYIASNSYMDKLPFYERPIFDSVTLMWGAVGNIGMRWKAFASADFLNATPDALLSVSDCCKILQVTCGRMDPPEWYNCQHYDMYTREAMLRPTAGFGSGGGYKPGENVATYPTMPEFPGVEGGAPAKNDEPPPEEVVEEEDIPGTAPLGGWPMLHFVPKDELAPRLVMPFQEGARVRLFGLSSKNGMQGILLKQLSDGKWKVFLDDGSGHALLKTANLEVISYPEESEVLEIETSRKKARFLKKQGAVQKAAEQAALKEAAAQKIAALAQGESSSPVEEGEVQQL
mmetsp:Transcript_55854/g.122618  ORF Transcript_55854/g.122618 Transcript_55854/m.122618 type:complete len:798 (-) Transcript_55854:69-2462(-)